MLYRFNYTDDSIEWADMIIPTGGDGTFLLASSKIRNNKKPVVGFNSDPEKSEGNLCLPKYYSYHIKDAIEKLQKGNFKWLFRTRVRVTLKGQPDQHCVIQPRSLYEIEEFDPLEGTVATVCLRGDQSQVLPFLALNEV